MSQSATNIHDRETSNFFAQFKNQFDMDYVVIIFFAFLHLAKLQEVPQGGCSCAVFSVRTPTDPLIEHRLPLNVSCDQDGAKKCEQLCIILSQGAKERAPALICEKLNRHVDDLLISVHTKACDAEEWKFTGLEMSEAICCHNGKETACSVPTE